MPTITISIEIPEGASVTTTDQTPDDTLTPEAGSVAAEADPARVEEFFRDYLSDNGRELYRGAAEVEHASGAGYTFDDIGEQIGRSYGSTQSIHRTTGRSARKWRDVTGTEAPIRLEWMEYEWHAEEGGMRTSYRLPDGLADQIAAF